MGYYSERHGNKSSQSTSSTPSNNSPKRSFYRERHLKEIPKPESLMSRVLNPLKAAGQELMAQPEKGYFFSLPTVSLPATENPFERAARVARSESLSKSIPNSGLRTAVEIGSDILAFGSPQMLKSGIKTFGRASSGTRGAVTAVRDIFRPRQVSKDIESGIKSAGSKIKSEYSGGLNKLVSKYKGKGVSFLDELDSPSTLAEKKLFDSVKEDAAFQKIDLGNLGLEDSKKVLDMIKGKSGIFEKEVGPLNFNEIKSVGRMKAKQVDTFPDIKNIDKPYGLIEDFEELTGKAANILEGSGNRILKSEQLSKLRNLDKGLFKRARNYRRANVVAKAARNPIVQGLTGLGLGGGTAAAFFRRRY